MKKIFIIMLAVIAGNAAVTAGSANNYSSSEASDSITDVQNLNPTAVEAVFAEGGRLIIDFYGENIFRMFRDNSGGILRDPEATPPAKILVDNPRQTVTKPTLTEEGNIVTVSTEKIDIQLYKSDGKFRVINKETGKTVIEPTKPVLFEPSRVTLTLKADTDEYFYGGGVQNGRFSHKGKVIAIENQNSWTDKGVASPCPFYWSTKGYGVMFYTFRRGKYDFGTTTRDTVTLYHETDYLDVFFMIDDGAVALLNDYYQLTGNPVLLPKFAFYEGHLNAYNRDYWAVDTAGIPFEDGKLYKESQRDNGGIKESLNGEKDNYQFSARAVIDRYKSHDMPFGWLLPNDGYGAGYGQTTTLDGNIANLRSLTDYAHKNGVEIGLWTQSDLHPKANVEALLQRDIVKEVRDAGVRVLKTDVAWVGRGYSFGLNGIADAAQIMTYYGNDARPFIISLDGWAGTQRYAGVWTGDQTGGLWEYIRFHIPTYIGAGLSGIPNITSDMDGIFGGKNLIVNTRDFQWKTFTPMQLNMDGWGQNEKYPHALGEPATSINRNYLKLKSQLIPYTYSIAKEAVDGLPMIRAIFLEYPNAYTLGKSTQYQFLYGPYFLVAPIYQNTNADAQGNDIRNGIYLPPGVWYDYFDGTKYDGGKIINSFDAPLWKLPVFVKAGAIIPLANANNNVSEIDGSRRSYELYPAGSSSFLEYDDDGKTEEYRLGQNVTTIIESVADDRGHVTVTVYPADGISRKFIKDKSTEFIVNLTEKPSKIAASIGSQKIKLTEVFSPSDYDKAKANVFFYDSKPNLNCFATKGSEFEKVEIIKNPQLKIKLEVSDITANETILEIEGYKFEPADKSLVKTGAIAAPVNAKVTDENTEAFVLRPSWDEVSNADYYEIEFDGMLYSTIKATDLLFENLEAETDYTFRLRAVNKDVKSEWTEIKATTKSNPLEFAITGLMGETSAENQGRSLTRLFDFEEGELWHTRYDVNALPFDLIIDLKTINTIDKFHYLPRENAGNGTLLKGSVSTSFDKKNWTPAGSFEWERNADTKIFIFDNKPTARYVRLSITDGVGGYGSGRELYVFKLPGTESYLPGDLNNDGKIDANDLTSYRNYIGLRRGDGDFDGYIGNGDLNRNGLIDAYDVSTAAIAIPLPGQTDFRRLGFATIGGDVSIRPAKQSYNAGETVEIRVSGDSLKAVNAISFALEYNPADYEYIGIDTLGTNGFEDMTVDRLHSNGHKSLYPTFVNTGGKPLIEGSRELFVIKLKAKRKIRYALKPTDGFIVDRRLNIRTF
ncbi:MAG: discoidin domain-containing protein [Tannerella sp.]|jgi:hypothetical protein|nr:discoidin domain-containing protein [Tannerella sp.]